MSLRLILSCVAACGLWMASGVAQEPYRPIRVTPRPAQPSAPTRPVPSQQKVLVAPALHTLDANELRMIALQTAPPEGLTKTEQSGLQRVSERLRHKDRAAAEAEWGKLVQSTAGRQPDVDAMVRYVLNTAYLDSNRDLHAAAEKVRYYDAQKTAAQGRRADLERAKRELDRGASPTNTVSVRSLNLGGEYRPGARAVTTGPVEPMTAESVADELQRIVVLCDHADDNAQRANLDLQSALQKQSQTLQTMSNVSKTLHDTAKNMVNNIR